MKFITILLSLFLFSCSSLDIFTKEEQNSGAYSKGELGQFSSVNEGIILSIKKVKISGSKGIGTVFGGALGGLAGASSTNKKYNKEAATAVGALAGAILGATLEKFSTQDVGYEFLIDTKQGVKAFTDTTNNNLKVGDEVYIIHGNGPIRISKK